MHRKTRSKREGFSGKKTFMSQFECAPGLTHVWKKSIMSRPS